MKALTIKSWYDESKVTIIPVHGTINQFKSGRCWNAGCFNQYQFIHLNRNGRADYAYCSVDFELSINQRAYFALKLDSYEIEEGAWVRPHRGILYRVELMEELEDPEHRKMRLRINKQLMKKLVKIAPYDDRAIGEEA